MKLKLTSLTILLLFYSITFCQRPMWSNLHPGNQVNCMAEEGPYIWFGTNSGVIKYDTASGVIEQFNVVNAPLLGSTINRIWVDPLGVKYIYHSNGTIQFNEFDGWRNAVPNNFLCDVCVKSSGESWYANSESIRHMVNGLWEEFYQIEGVPVNDFVEIEAEQNSAQTWFYHPSGYIFRYENGLWDKWNVPNYTSSDLIIPMSVYSNRFKVYNGIPYILNQSAGSGYPSFLKLDNGVWSSSSCSLATNPLDVFLTIQVDANGDIKIPHGYIDTSNNNYVFGVYRYNGLSWSEDFHLTGVAPFPLSSQFYTFQCVDANDNFYCSNGVDDPLYTFDMSGLWRLSRNNIWNKIDFKNGNIPFNYELFHTTADDTGNVFFSYPNYGNSIYKLGADNSVISVPLCKDSFRVNTLAVDTNNDLWIAGIQRGSNNTIYLINNTTCATYTLNNFQGIRLYAHKGKIYFLVIDMNSNFFLGNISSGQLSYTPIPLISGAYAVNDICVTDSCIFAKCHIGVNGVGHSSFLQYSNNQWRLWDYAAAGLNSDEAYYCNADKHGNFWLISYERNDSRFNIIKYDGVTYTIVYSFVRYENAISATLCIDKNDLLSVYTGTSMYQTDGVNSEIYPGLASTYFVFEYMYPRPDGTIVCPGFQDGICIFDTGGVPLYYPLQNTVRGSVYLDRNFNNVRDSTIEVGLAGQLVGVGQNVVSTDDDGNYTLQLPAGNHIIKLYPQSYAAPTVTDTFQVSFNNGQGQSIGNKNFGCYYVPGIKDLAVTIAGFSTSPGSTALYAISYKNLGTVTQSGSVVFYFDSLITADLDGLDSAIVAGDSVTWAFTDLEPHEERCLYFSGAMSTNATIGQTIHSSAFIYPFANDTFLGNNYCLQALDVTGPFDPNEKNVWPPGNVDTGQLLTYTITFQNTGNAPARNVFISDTLSSNLDLTTLKVIGASHNYTYTLNHSVITFKFININLPDSNINEKRSHGFIQYTIKPLMPDYGDSIKNTAYIYFDYNLPVRTNTALTVLTSPLLSIEPISYNTLETQVFPNPTSGHLSVRTLNYSGSYNFKLADLSGREVVNWRGGNGINNFDCTILAAGTYVYEITTETSLKSRGRIVFE